MNKIIIINKRNKKKFIILQYPTKLYANMKIYNYKIIFKNNNQKVLPRKPLLLMMMMMMIIIINTIARIKKAKNKFKNSN